jgi:hypothetical protein
MKSVSFMTVMVAALLLLAPVSVLSQDGNKEALAAAERWLALVDEGRLGESWEAASSYFKGAVTMDQWEASVVGARGPLGEVISRKVKSSEYLTELPGAPDGEYVVILFETSFENKKSAVETVTPMKDKDGSWKVSGYYVR